MMRLNRFERSSRPVRQGDWAAGRSEFTSRVRSSLSDSSRSTPRRYSSRGLSNREIEMVAHIFGFRDADEMIAFAARLDEKKTLQQHPPTAAKSESA
jgi:hypothetical protein